MAECVFCEIANRRLPTPFIGEAEGLVAFSDRNPQAPTHWLLVPTEHIPRLSDVTPDHTRLLGQLLQFAKRLAEEQGLQGYRVVINCGEQAGQSVWHLHAHVLAGRALRWPPG